MKKKDILTLHKLKNVCILLKSNRFSDCDPSAFANAEGSFKIEIRKALRVRYILLSVKLLTDSFKRPVSWISNFEYSEDEGTDHR